VEALLAPRLARPVEADEQWSKSRTRDPDALTVRSALNHRCDPTIVLLAGRRDVSPPAVAHQEDIRDRLVRQVFDHQLAHQAVPVIGPFPAIGIKGHQVVVKFGLRNSLDRHRRTASTDTKWWMKRNRKRSRLVARNPARGSFDAR